MEVLYLRHATSVMHQSFPTKKFSPKPVRTKRVPFLFSRFFTICAKQTSYRDFPVYAKPLRLLPAKEVKVCTDTTVEKILKSLRENESRSLYKVDIGTSRILGSNFSDLNAGLLLCLIDKNGGSILQRIPASLATDSKAELLLDSNSILHFQRGSVDEFIFEGPKLGRIEAIWISLESGQWRLGSVCLTVISDHQPSSSEAQGDNIEYRGLKYNFEAEDILLGEGSDNSMVEVRPISVSELTGIKPSELSSRSLLQPTFAAEISNEESMREYAELKFSLLLYDSILIVIGTSITSLAGENSGFAFLSGGIVGFLYLLLLQRSVDELPAPPSTSKKTESSDQIRGGYRNPLYGISLAVGICLLALKLNSGDLQVMLSPREVVVCMMGFLACKVAVVFAALRPMPLDLKITK